MNKLAILNTSILTNSGDFELKDITLHEAIDLVNNNELDSAIGHQSTAEILTTLLGVEIPMNRQMFKQEPGQQALVFKLLSRPEEGKILTKEEIEAIGYKFQLLTMKDWSIGGRTDIAIKKLNHLKEILKNDEAIYSDISERINILEKIRWYEMNTMAVTGGNPYPVKPEEVATISMLENINSDLETITGFIHSYCPEIFKTTQPDKEFIKSWEWAIYTI